MSIASGFVSLAGRVSDLVAPPVCPVSDEPVERHGLAAARAFADLWFIDDPLCEKCGFAFAHALPGLTLCAACHTRTDAALSRCRAALSYHGAARDLVLGLKWAARRDGAALIGRWLALAGRDLLMDAPVLVPVPLHDRRLRQRRFNQSQFLAAALARHKPGLVVNADLLVKTRMTRPQAELSGRQRQTNLTGAFALRKGAQVEARAYCLIDDVRTTGTTLEMCARVLKRAGAARVDALCLARVNKPDRAPI